jgi:glycosyltransferase involved in cell wall biosynthesis
LASLIVTPSVSWEVIVVDNGSTDQTAALLAAWSPRLPLRAIRCETRGLSHARNAGMRQSAGEIIAWTDDDCIVDPGWLQGIVTEFVTDPTVQGLGGRVLLRDNRDLPLTIQPRTDRAELAPEGRFSRSDLMLIAGCNMAFRRVAAVAIGEFDPRLGAGTKSGAAEDIDYLYRLVRAGGRVVYRPDVLVYHNHGRRLLQDGDRLRRSYAIGRGAFYAKHIARGEGAALRLLIAEFASIVVQLIALALHRARWASHVLLGVAYRLLRR